MLGVGDGGERSGYFCTTVPCECAFLAVSCTRLFKYSKVNSDPQIYFLSIEFEGSPLKCLCYTTFGMPSRFRDRSIEYFKKLFLLDSSVLTHPIALPLSPPWPLKPIECRPLPLVEQFVEPPVEPVLIRRRYEVPRVLLDFLQILV